MKNYKIKNWFQYYVFFLNFNFRGKLSAIKCYTLFFSIADSNPADIYRVRSHTEKHFQFSFKTLTIQEKVSFLRK